ncbi:MAG: aminomethyl-transferring glycine dehydrogenase subunit GcvPA [Phycisphaerales bacterium]|nr:MAG: aminomethyl-transferring glycine dehydrogenase subunit GcvPA [Phycisphaerales bacterium]
MRYTQLTDNDLKTILNTIGVRSIDDLFAVIPADQRLKGKLGLPAGLSEMELLAELDRLAAANQACDRQVCFLGAGAYDHYIPTAVDALAGQSSFVTAYTPYQAEASQGSLQAFYEFQTFICQLTGMDVANASLYEGATATAEAVIMARNINRRDKVVVSAGINPDYLRVLRTYFSCLSLELVTCPLRGGLTDMEALSGLADDRTSSVVVQSPNFFGCVEELQKAADLAHRAGGLSIGVFDPIACAILKPPGALGADIAVGEGQPLGIPMSLGGPYLGLLAARQQHLRKMPGRMIGMTSDAAGKPAYTLTLQTREQHIRREKATSNVCTNQGLVALRATVYMALMGRSGLTKVASLCLEKAHYAARQIASLDGYSLRFGAPFFREFVVRTDRDVDSVLEHCRTRSILAGVPLGQWFDDMKDCFLVAVTEKRSKEQIDALADALSRAAR